MTTNSIRHADRVAKVKEGLRKAQVAADKVQAIVTMFDECPETEARVVAERVKFQVSLADKSGELFSRNPDAEGRRQMGRAYFFLTDLIYRRTGQSITTAKARTDADFYRRWTMQFDDLKDQVNVAVNELTKATEPVLPPPPPIDAGPDRDALYMARAAQINATIRNAAPGRLDMTAQNPALAALYGARAADYQARLARDAMYEARAGQLNATIRNPAPGRLDMATQNQALAAWHHQAVLSQQQDVSTQMLTAWNSASISITNHFFIKLNILDTLIVVAGNAVDAAYTNYAETFKAEAKRIQKNVNTAKSLFKALESAPFPFSLVGTIGRAMCEQLHADSEIPEIVGSKPQVFQTGGDPLLARLQTQLSDVSDWYQEITRLGARAGDLTNSASLHAIVSASINTTKSYVHTAFKRLVDSAWGDGATASRNQAFEFLRSVDLRNYTNKAQQIMRVVSLVNQRQEDTKRAIDGAFGATQFRSQEEMMPFVELFLYGQWFESLFHQQVPATHGASAQSVLTSVANTIAGKVHELPGVPPDLVNQLANDRLDIVKLKSGKGQSETIFSQSHIPWEAGHPNHKTALIYFFAWYRVTINPFDILTGRMDPEAARESMRQYIQRLGTAIKGSERKTGLLGLGHKIASFEDIDIALAQATASSPAP